MYSVYIIFSFNRIYFFVDCILLIKILFNIYRKFWNELLDVVKRLIYEEGGVTCKYINL